MLEDKQEDIEAFPAHFSFSLAYLLVTNESINFSTSTDRSGGGGGGDFFRYSSFETSRLMIFLGSPSRSTQIIRDTEILSELVSIVC